MCVMELLKDVDFTYMGYILLLGLGLIVLQIMVRTLTKSRRKARKPETYLDLRKPEDQIAAISKVDFEVRDGPSPNPVTGRLPVVRP